jgi:hypothetical protein
LQKALGNRRLIALPSHNIPKASEKKEELVMQQKHGALLLFHSAADTTDNIF